MLVSRCDTAVLHTASFPLYDVLSASTVLVSRCNTAVLRTSPLYDVPSIVLVSRCDTAVLRTASSLCHNIPSTVLFPRPAEHASHDTAGKCKLWQSGHSYSTHKATFHPAGNGRPAQNSLRLAYFNAQSCRQASEINDVVVAGDFDILLMTETWLYASGDETYINRDDR